jgi:hypothetical protein
MSEFTCQVIMDRQRACDDNLKKEGHVPKGEVERTSELLYYATICVSPNEAGDF